MDYRNKRPRLEDDTNNDVTRTTTTKTTTTSSLLSNLSTQSPTIKLLQTEIRTLRAELTHSQSIRSIDRKNATQSGSRLKRQLADACEEITLSSELIDSLRAQVDQHSEIMEESRKEWLERIQWYEDQFAEKENNRGHDGSYYDSAEEDEHDSGKKCDLLQERLDATLDQVEALEHSLKETEEGRVAAEERATELRCAEIKKKDEENKKPPVDAPRELRLKIAETERANRELQRQNDTLKSRCQDMVQHKERYASAKRKVQQLEKEVQSLIRQVEEGEEAQRRWMGFRNDIVAEGFLVGDENNDNMSINEEDRGTLSTPVPPEISTVVRKFQTMKRTAKQQEDEIIRITQLSGAHLRRCKVLETQLNEKSQSISLLEKKIKEQEAATNQLELENRKIIAQQQIWKRESDGMRALLDTYEQQETIQSKSPSRKRGTNADGLELSLKSARDEVKLLSETNDKLEETITGLRSEQQTAKAEHERVLEKFHKLRNALMEERSKAESAEARACQAETLAGKGSYNSETTSILHLKENPLMDAIKEKYQKEIDSLKRRLEETDAIGRANNNQEGDGAAAASAAATATTTPAPSKSRGSFGSAGSDSAVDVQKLHSRLKEQFRNQIALFRQGVYLITGFKIDMSQSDNDHNLFTVRSVYGEREEDHIVFKWSPKKKKNKLDMLNTGK